MCKYTLQARAMIDNYNLYKDEPEILTMMAGLFAEGLHRQRAIHTGLISEDAANRPKGGKVCKEHFFGRTASAKKIFEQIAKGKSIDRITCLIKSRSRVHYTTSAENMKLLKFDHLHWREAYRQAGINLIPYVKRNHKYVYKVDGTVYNSISDIASKYHLSTAGANYRFTSKTKKWKGWTRDKIS